MQERIGLLCDFLAVVRTYIPRDFKGGMAALPEPEFPTRLVKTLCKLVDAHALLYDRMPTYEDELIALRLIQDNIPTERLRILSVLAKTDLSIPTPEIGNRGQTSPDMTRRVLNDLKALGIVKQTVRGQGQSDLWIFPNGEHKEAFLTISRNVPADIDKLRVENRIGGNAPTETINNVNDIYYYNNINYITSDNLSLPLSESHPAVNQDAEAHKKSHSVVD